MKGRSLLRITIIKSKKFLFLLLSVCILLANFTVVSSANEWQELSGEHFIVYFKSDDNFAKDVLHRAEKYYQRIAIELGYPRYSEFWLWDKRVKIYVYSDRESYIKTTGMPEWSEGMADYTNKQIASFIDSKGFLESVLPHEMAHLIFRDFVGFKGEIPIWLDEGVAQWAEEAKRQEIKLKAKQLFENTGLLYLEDMMKTDVRHIAYKDAVYIRPAHRKNNAREVLFLTADGLISTYYLQSASLVGFLIERYGSDNFAHFCRQLRDGKQFQEALMFVYNTYISNIEEFENRWMQYIQE